MNWYMYASPYKKNFGNVIIYYNLKSDKWRQSVYLLPWRANLEINLSLLIILILWSIIDSEDQKNY